jgi:uncharacterized protein YbjT (DUF2867 family)
MVRSHQANEEIPMVLVTGATGRAGSEVVRALLARGERVRAFVRDPEEARAALGDGAELAVGDFADADSVRAALEGADTLFLSGPDDPRRVGWETRAIDAAAASGVRRIVKLSSVSAEPGAPAVFWEWHGLVERHLAESGIPSVILRACAFMSNVAMGAAGVAEERCLYAPAGDARIAMIDPRDVGAVAAAVLTDPAHDGQTYLITGPEAITYGRVARELAAATGSDVEFVDLPDADAIHALVGDGLPPSAAEQVVGVFGQLKGGAGERVTTCVEELTGRPPRDFAAWARDHAHLFAPAAVGAGR